MAFHKGTGFDHCGVGEVHVLEQVGMGPSGGGEDRWRRGSLESWVWSGWFHG